MQYIIKGFPLSPTSNTLYAPVGGRLIKTAVGREYVARCNLWRIRNFRVVDDVQKLLKSMPEGTALRLDTTFVFLHGRLVGKKGQLKKIDFQNRQKSAVDCLFDVLKIDDSLITEGMSEKITCENSRDEQIIFKLSFSKLKTLADSQNQESIRV